MKGPVRTRTGPFVMEIARASIEDVDALLPLVSGYRTFYGRETDPDAERAYISAHLKDGTSVVFLARLDGNAAGFVQLFPAFNTVRLRPALILEDLFVVPDARRHGVASALLDAALGYARETGAAVMFLETAYTNVAAQAVYERAGWTRENQFYKYNAPLE